MTPAACSACSGTNAQARYSTASVAGAHSALRRVLRCAIRRTVAHPRRYPANEAVHLARGGAVAGSVSSAARLECLRRQCALFQGKNKCCACTRIPRCAALRQVIVRPAARYANTLPTRRRRWSTVISAKQTKMQNSSAGTVRARLLLSSNGCERLCERSVHQLGSDAACSLADSGRRSRGACVSAGEGVAAMSHKPDDECVPASTLRHVARCQGVAQLATGAGDAGWPMSRACTSWFGCSCSRLAARAARPRSLLRHGAPAAPACRCCSSCGAACGRGPFSRDS